MKKDEKLSNSLLQNIDFLELGKFYPALDKHLKKTKRRIGERSLTANAKETATLKDWKDPKALRELTYAILWKYFGLRLEIPLDSLIPPVPSRFDYIIHIKHLLLGTEKGGNSNMNGISIPNEGIVKGIDVGCGASCIYPLLACSAGKDYENWKFLALETNESSLEYAVANIQRNGLQDRISLVDNKSSNNRILPKSSILKKYGPYFDFVMCNPPFYADSDQIDQQRVAKELEPHSTCTGNRDEMICDGGETTFIKKLIKESKKIHKSIGKESDAGQSFGIGWFTSLVGRKADADELYCLLCNHADPADDIRLYTIRQGYTSRWILSWKWAAAL